MPKYQPRNWLAKTLIAFMLAAGVFVLRPALADLLGILPSFPLLTYDNTGVILYNSSTNRLTVNASPIAFRASPTQPPVLVTPVPGSGEVFAININVDESGTLLGGIPGDDLLVTGNATVNGTNYSGTLLSGEVRAFGFEDSGGPTDSYDFEFEVTGGQLAFLFEDQDIGVVLTSEMSSFNGSFVRNFIGAAKGTLGSVPLICTGRIGDFVWNDLDRDGIQDPGESGLANVTVNLLDGNGMPAGTATTGSDGGYIFEGLCADDYTVDVDESTLPQNLQTPTDPL